MVFLLYDKNQVSRICEEIRQQYQGGLGESLAVVVGGVIAIVAIFESSLDAFDGQQSVASGVAEYVLKSQTIGLQVGCEIFPQPQPQQAATLLQNQFEFLYAGCLINVIGDVLGVILNQLPESVSSTLMHRMR